MVPNIWKHAAVLTVGIILLLGLPLLKVKNVFSGASTDAVSSASVIIEQPSGNYIVLIEKDIHSDEKKLEAWVDFFSGGDFTYLFEDIVCSVSSSDPGATNMAKSFQSRLPENQMRIQMEDATLLTSRIEYGKYDVVILSEEMAEKSGIDAEKCKENAMVIHIGSENNLQSGSDGEM